MSKRKTPLSTEPTTTFVIMVRDKETNKAPYESVVHPDEVENMQKGGWEIKHKEK